MTTPILFSAAERLRLIPRLNDLVVALAAHRQTEEDAAGTSLLEAITCAGLSIEHAAQRSSGFTQRFRAENGLVLPVSDREPWQMTREEFEDARFAIRRGAIEPTGAYFATPGNSTYYDESTEDGGVARYDLSGLLIADTRRPAVTLPILREALLELDIGAEETVRLRSFIADVEGGECYIDYLACDELLLSHAARRLGWDGILVWENDDYGNPSSVFAWAVDRITCVAQNHRRAVLDAVEQGAPVAEHILREVTEDDTARRFSRATPSPVAIAAERVRAQLEQVLEDVGIDDAKLRVQIREDAIDAARTGHAPASGHPGIDALAARVVALSGRLAGDGRHAGDAGETITSFLTNVDAAFGSGFADRLFAGGDFHVVEAEHDLPAHHRHPEGGVAGVYDDATAQTYFVASNISGQTVKAMLLHEIGVHYGLRRMLGNRAEILIARAGALAEQGHPAAVAARSKVPATTHRDLVNEEILANLVGEQAAQPMPLVKRARARLKAFLFRLGANVELGPPELLMLAEGSLRRAVAVGGKPRFTLMARAKLLGKRFFSGKARPRRSPLHLAYQRSAVGAGADLNADALRATAERLGISDRAIASTLLDNVELLRDRDRFIADSNVMEPKAFPKYPLGTAKILHWQPDVANAYVDFLDEFDSAVLTTAESEDGIRKHPTFARYVEMLREGHEAPYIHVFERNGKYVSSNRRRTLAAQETGARIRGWHGVDNAETGLPLKYGDVVAVYAEELARANRASATATEAFRQWFGESKIIEDDGQPKVVHHFTYFDFTVFDRQWGASHFGRDPEGVDTVGSWFTDNPAARYVAPGQGKRMDVYLSIRRPFYLDDVEEGDSFDQLRKLVKDAGGTTALRERLKSEGYDGIILNGTWLDGRRQNVMIPLEPQQIKSADFNDGAYDPANADIRFHRLDTENPALRAWFGESQIATPERKPLVVYHGTGADFSVFEKRRLGASTGATDAREGFFFALDPAVAAEFAWADGERGSVMPFYLSMQRPYITDFVVTPATTVAFAELVRKARDEGYDGVASFGEFLGKETSVFVAFEPTQIKSALCNSSYNAADPDIRFSRALVAQNIAVDRAEGVVF